MISCIVRFLLRGIQPNKWLGSKNFHCAIKRIQQFHVIPLTMLQRFFKFLTSNCNFSYFIKQIDFAQASLKTSSNLFTVNKNAKKSQSSSLPERVNVLFLNDITTVVVAKLSVKSLFSFHDSVIFVVQQISKNYFQLWIL